MEWVTTTSTTVVDMVVQIQVKPSSWNLRVRTIVSRKFPKCKQLEYIARAPGQARRPPLNAQHQQRFVLFDAVYIYSSFIHL
jgi:hypothetical protein